MLSRKAMDTNMSVVVAAPTEVACLLVISTKMEDELRVNMQPRLEPGNNLTTNVVFKVAWLLYLKITQNSFIRDTWCQWRTLCKLAERTFDTLPASIANITEQVAKQMVHCSYKRNYS